MMPPPDRRRILFLDTLPHIAGGQQVLLHLTAGLPAHDCYAMLPGPGPLSAAMTAQGVVCHCVPMRGYQLVQKTWRDVFGFPLEQARLIRHCLRIIHQEQIDLLYANSARTFVWGTIAASLAGRPIVWHHHNILGHAATLRLLQTVARLPTVHRIIAASQAAQRQFDMAQPKTVVIPNGIDIHRFHRDPALGSALRQSLAIPAAAPVVGMIGDLLPIKGQHVLLAALQQSAPDIYGLFVGAPRPDDRESQAYADQLHAQAGARVLFLGRREDIPAVLNALDLLVIASEWETGPLVLLEALASETPVLSTPVGWSPEYLPLDALFPIGATTQLANLLRCWLAAEPRRAQAARAGRTMAEQLSVAHFQQAVAAVLQDVVRT